MSEDQGVEKALAPEELPPVEPPSAGFILQLFVVPGLIVAAVVGVWLLFGKLASGEQDWHELVVELQHPNPHRRWRAALGLGQILKADQDLGENGQHLSQSQELARALAHVTSSELARNSQADDDLKFQAFLTRTLGLFDVPDTVLPPLRQAMQPEFDRDVRKNAIGAVAVIADRAGRTGGSLKSPELLEALLQVSSDADPLVRQLAAFTLGLLPEDAGRQRLEVMLDDSDRDTRVNAAIGLARQHDVGGFRVFRDILKSETAPAESGPAAMQRSSDSAAGSASTNFGRFLALKNSLAAIEQLARDLDSQQQQELLPLLTLLADEHDDTKIRVAARGALNALQRPLP